MTSSLEMKPTCPSASLICKKAPCIACTSTVSPLFKTALILEDTVALVRRLALGAATAWPGMAEREVGALLPGAAEDAAGVVR